MFDENRNTAREDAIVGNLLKAEPIGIIVLGGAHDLTDNIDRVSEGTCEVVTVTTEAYRRVAK